jgi:hypothetical protein
MKLLIIALFVILCLAVAEASLLERARLALKAKLLADEREKMLAAVEALAEQDPELDKKNFAWRRRIHELNKDASRACLNCVIECESPYLDKPCPYTCDKLCNGKNKLWSDFEIEMDKKKEMRALIDELFA